MNEIRKTRQDDMRLEGKVTSAENNVGRMKYFLNKERQGKNIKGYLARIERDLDVMLKSLDEYEGMDMAAEDAHEKMPLDVLKDVGRLTGIEMVVMGLHQKMESGEKIMGIVQ